MCYRYFSKQVLKFEEEELVATFCIEYTMLLNIHQEYFFIKIKYITS